MRRVAALVLAACAFAVPDFKATASPQPPARVAAAAETPRLARAVLVTLPVKGRAPKTGYTRAQFGPAWADANRNGCDTRNDILNRDLTVKIWQAGTRNCVVVAGTLADPYTAKTFQFTKAKATLIQIDHVVALSDAWQKGAQALSPARREQFGNDPLNLLAVEGRSNMQKGDGDAATWLPSNKAYRCRYVARQVTVKAAYGLWVTPAERTAIAAILATCPTEPITPVAPLAALPALVTPTTTATTAVPGGEPYYANCDTARASGVAPLRRGQPGYRSALDRDGDGIACE